jgi:hypothetical protein
MKAQGKRSAAKSDWDQVAVQMEDLYRDAQVGVEARAGVLVHP